MEPVYKLQKASTGGAPKSSHNQVNVDKSFFQESERLCRMDEQFEKACLR